MFLGRSTSNVLIFKAGVLNLLLMYVYSLFVISWGPMGIPLMLFMEQNMYQVIPSPPYAHQTNTFF